MNNNNSLFSLCLVASYHPISYWQLQFALLLSVGCHYYQRRTHPLQISAMCTILCILSLLPFARQCTKRSANQHEYTGNFSCFSVGAVLQAGGYSLSYPIASQCCCWIWSCFSISILYNYALRKSIFINLTHKRAKIRRDCVCYSQCQTDRKRIEYRQKGV